MLLVLFLQTANIDPLFATVMTFIYLLRRYFSISYGVQLQDEKGEIPGTSITFIHRRRLLPIVEFQSGWGFHFSFVWLGFNFNLLNLGKYERK